jgi:hypothetical protein
MGGKVFPGICALLPNGSDGERPRCVTGQILLVAIGRAQGISRRSSVNTCARLHSVTGPIQRDAKNGQKAYVKLVVGLTHGNVIARGPSKPGKGESRMNPNVVPMALELVGWLLRALMSASAMAGLSPEELRRRFAAEAERFQRNDPVNLPDV